MARRGDNLIRVSDRAPITGLWCTPADGQSVAATGSQGATVTNCCGLTRKHVLCADIQLTM